MLVLIICMPERRESGELLRRTFENMGMDARIVDAVIGSDESVLKTIMPHVGLVARATLGNPRSSHFQTNRPGALGCYASHLKALKIAS
jgi:GR25 family glycosyltransferase involved in LPS biosynthesis